MKVLIELDDDVFKDIKESNFDSARAIVRNFQATITDSIRNGTPIPDNATNGDMIKAMFPYIEANEIKTDTGGYIEVKYLDTTDKCDATAFRKNWWNVLYTEKRGNE